MRLVELEKEIKELKKLLTEATTLSKQLKSFLATYSSPAASGADRS